MIIIYSAIVDARALRLESIVDSMQSAGRLLNHS